MARGQRPVSLCNRLPVTLFALTLAFTQVARAQTCTEQKESPTQTVSAADLRIPRHAWKHFENARSASQRNQPAVFERETALALAAAPQFAEIYLLRAAHEVQAGHYEAAFANVSTARQIQPNLPWSGVLVAGALNQLHRYDEAAAELDRGRGDELGSWQEKFERARAEIGRRNTVAALHWSELAVAAAPVGCTDARLVRANALQLAGRSPDALRELETFLVEDRRQGQGTSHADVQAALDRTRLSAQQQQDRGLLAVN